MGKRDYHVGGTQLGMFLPKTDWQIPRVPTIPGHVRDVAIDTETRDDGLRSGLGPGWATRSGYVCGVSLAWDDQKIYLPIRHPDTDCVDRGAVRGLLADLYRRSAEDGLRLVFMAAPYDVGWIWAEFDLMPSPQAKIDDVGLMAVMVDENQLSYGLDDICKRLGLPGKDETLLREAAAAYGVDPKSEMFKLPARYVGPYAEDDAAQTLACVPRLREMMAADEVTAAYQTDADLILCCVEMRRRGIRVDTEAVERGKAELTAKRDVLLVDMSRRAGRSVTLDMVRSWQHMAAMCDAEGVPYPRTEKTSQPSFKAEWMRVSDHWLPRMAEQVDRMTNVVDKFLDGYLLSFSHRGRIHPTYHQFKSDDGGTKTQRFSISDPPLQQAPGATMEKTDDLGALAVGLFRGALLPEEGDLWLSPDVSSQEIRLIVHFAARLGLPRADEAVARYRENPRLDFHQFVADITKLPRSRGKIISFCKAYGGGAAKIAAQMGSSVDEARAAIAAYDAEVPFFKDLAATCSRAAERRGYVKLIDGARCHYDRWEPARRDGGYSVPCRHDEAQRRWPNERLRRSFTFRAMNSVIQGSGARQVKLAMRDMWREGIVPLLSMHDEVPVSVSNERTGKRVCEIMRDAVKLEVPVVIDEEYGTCWSNAKHTYDEARAMQR